MHLGDYTLTEKIGEGATGAVYRAYDRRRGRTVAVKLTHASPDSTALTQLQREARTLNLSHPNILAAERLEPLPDGRLLVVMSLVEGVPLTSWLVPVAFERALGVVRQVAAALAHAHARGVLHCDVKPANLLVSGTGTNTRVGTGVNTRVKLLDFGLSRRLGDPSVGIRGTLEYMSPEAARGQGWRPSSDLWSLGVVFYELLTGHAPFARKSVPETLRAIASGRVRPASEFQPGLPPETDHLLARLLNVSEAARYPSAEALLQDLEALATGSALTAVTEEAVRPRAAAPQRVRELPPKPAVLLGRSHELALLSHYLSDPECRLLTLQGLGGVGKTHLSLWLAHELGGFSHLHAAELADVESGGFVAALSSALGAEEPSLGALRQRLEGRRQFLLLDNFEHLTERAPLLEALLEACPGLVLLVTTRVRLGLAEEWVMPLQGLSFPTGLPEPDSASSYGALALLEHRARALGADFDFARASDLESASRICRQLQGHALGITLAAGLLRAQTLDALARSLETTFAGLGHGSGRHESLRAVFRESYALLSVDQRVLLSVLTLFEGGGEARAVQEITGADREALGALMDASLLEQTLEGRYVQHPLVRQFSREELDPPDAETLSRYRAYYQLELRELDAALRGSGRRRALASLTRDAPNLRASLQGATLSPEFGEPLRIYYTQQGRYREGLEFFGAKAGDYAAACSGWFALLQGDLAQAEALEILEMPDDRSRLLALNTRAGVLARRADFTEAKTTSLQVLALARHLEDAPMISAALSNLAMLEEYLGQPSAAVGYYEQSLELSEGEGNHAQTLVSLNNLASLYRFQGEVTQAKALLERGLLLGDKQRLTRMKPLLQLNFGSCLYAEGAYADAKVAYLEAHRALRERGDEATLVTVEAYLGQTCGAAGEAEEAFGYLQAALERAQRLGDQEGQLCALVRLAELLLRRGAGVGKRLAVLVAGHAFAEPLDRRLAESLAAHPSGLHGPDFGPLDLEVVGAALAEVVTLDEAQAALSA